MRCLRGEPGHLEEQTYKHDCGEEEGEGGKCGESHMETHIIICRTDSKWEFAV